MSSTWEPIPEKCSNCAMAVGHQAWCYRAKAPTGADWTSLAIPHTWQTVLPYADEELNAMHVLNEAMKLVPEGAVYRVREWLKSRYPA